MKPLCGVMIGAGFFAQFQAEAWRRIAGVEVGAVADADGEKARAFAARHGIPRSYDSVEAMLDAERPDFVDIVTRPDTHLALTRLAARRGAHVICQKPMAPTMADSVAMCEACEAAGVQLLIHENWRWQPWYREAKRQFLDEGALGVVREVSFDWRTGDGNGPEPYAAQPYFRTMPRLLIYESLVHLLDTFRFLFGPAHIVACETRRVNPVIAGEDWAEIRVRFESGPEGFIHGDRHTGPHPAPVAMGEMRIAGSAGTLRIDGDGFLHLAQNGASESRVAFIPPTAGYKGDSVVATQEHLLACLRSGQPAESEGRTYLRTVALVEDCYRLAKL
jgi:D-apiose dehydrogenase